VEGLKDALVKHDQKFIFIAENSTKVALINIRKVKPGNSAPLLAMSNNALVRQACEVDEEKSLRKPQRYPKSCKRR
jgi:hypothetical protein